MSTVEIFLRELYIQVNQFTVQEYCYLVLLKVLMVTLSGPTSSMVADGMNEVSGGYDGWRMHAGR